jgi:hypothetical protein
MAKGKKEIYEWYLNSMTPEQIAANGGRKKCIAALKKHERSRKKYILWGYFKGFLNGVWFLTKGLILALTALYFVNAILL